MSERLADLFGRYVEDVRSGGEPDIAAYLDEAGDERETLAGMLAAHAVLNPRLALPEDVVAARARTAPSLGWDTLLPALREERGITRGRLVARLAEALGHPEATHQVGEYVHLLETGGLQPNSVRPPVVDALAAVLRVPRALLDAARGAAAAAARPPDASVAYARMAPAPAPPPAAALFDDAAPRSAEIDDLFTGGDA